MPEKDPNGVPRPLPPERVDPAANNSGILIGEVKDPSPTVAGVQQPDNYKTAFVKVYQDAGVIGVAMLTLLGLCVLMGLFNVRLLKMYTSLTESRDRLDQARTIALEKMSLTVLTLQSTVTLELASLKQTIADQYSKLDRLSSESDKKLEILRREEVLMDKIADRLTQIEFAQSHRDTKD
jgi:hypothetical protein